MFLKLLGVSFLTLLIGFAGGYVVFGLNPKNVVEASTECPEKYTFINDVLDCGPKPAINKQEYIKLEYELENYIANKKKEESVSHVSVYFRDLAGGPTFGIDSDTNFVPASLLKVPLMMTYYSIAEKNPEVLKRETFFVKVNNAVSQSIASNETIKINTSYPVEELIDRMILNSDNLAYGLLDKFLERLYPGQNTYISTLKELGLVNPRNPAEATFTVKTYSSLFRQLYNASYLSPAMSDKALTLLTRTEFDKALAGGVPKSVKVAHKFGDREGLENDEKQFHDCGIIYYPNNPYLLCVMTIGTNDDNLVAVIKSISEMVYKEIDSRKL